MFARTPRHRVIGLAAAAVALALPALVATAGAPPQIGAPAPQFSAVDSNGKSHQLAGFRGKTVVLEWTNHECPFVGKHYATSNMQNLQKDAVSNGVVWLSVISSAPGRQGYVDGVRANALTESRGAAPTAVLLDPKGEVGRLYGATTTPHMYVIDAKGTLVYRGAIDDRPSARHADVQGANNYVRAALTSLAAGEKIEQAATRPYGCSVKYGS